MVKKVHTTLKKDDIIECAYAKNPNIDNTKLSMIFDAIIDEIAMALICDDKVELRGFGSLKKQERKEHLMRKPNNGDYMKISKRFSIYFRASKALLDKLNDKY